MEESKKKIEKYMQEATERLNAGDLDSAAFKVRKALEVLVKELCDEMEIEIRVKGKDRDNLNAILGKIKETNSETRVLKYSDIESMYTVKQVGNIASHDDEEKHLEKATGEIKVRNAIDTMYLLLESLSDNNKLKLKVSVNTMLESAKQEEDKAAIKKPEMNIIKPATSYKGAKNYAARTSKNYKTPVASSIPAEKPKKEKIQKDKTALKSVAKALKSIIKWDVLIAIMTAIVYSLGGVKYALHIGIAAMILVDILLIARAASKDKRKTLPTVAFVLIAALLIALSGVGSYFISPASAATRALNSGDSESAQSIIQSKIEGNTVQEKLFAKSVNNYYDKVVKEYTENQNDKEVKKKLQPLTRITSSDIGRKATDFIASIDAYSQGKEAYDNKDYVNAVKLLSKVTKDFPRFTEAQEMISISKDSYKKNLLEEVGMPKTLEECENALKLLNDGVKAFQDDSDIEVKAGEVRTTYLNILDSEVKKCVESYESDKAYELIANAKELLGNTDEIEELSKLIADAQPVSLYSLSIINQATYADAPYDNVKDTFGNEYQKDSAYLIDINHVQDESGYVKYNTSGGYRRIKGTIAVEEGAGEKFDVDIVIEDQNGQHLKEFTLTRDTKPVDIDINISGVESITFNVKNNNGNVFTTPGTGEVILGNFSVYK